MSIASREAFVDWCLKALGEPVVEVNIDDSQIDHRVDEALEHWHQYHFEGVEKVYLKQQITASTLKFTTSVGDNFQAGEKVVGMTSGAYAYVATEVGGRKSTGTQLLIRNITGTFVAGETVQGTTSLASGTLAATAFFTIGTYDQRYFDLPDIVFGVSRVLSFNAANSSKNLFDIQYQLRLNDLYDLASTSIIYYKTVMSHLALLDLELNGHPLYRFNRMAGRLYLDVNWESNLILGEFVVIECYRAMDPTTWSRIWNEPWLKKYATALIKKQWATNGKKFLGIQLPGGVTIDWQGMYNEAMNEIKELEDEMLNKSAPLEFFLG